MKLAKKILVAVVAAALAITCFAGCSNGSGETTAQAKVKVIDIELTSEEYAFGVDKNQPELMEEANALIKEIKENGQLDEICSHYFSDGTPVGVTSAEEDSTKDQLIVATNAEFEPFEYKQGDTFYGIDMEQTQRSKLLSELPPVDVVVTMGCNVQCPALPCRRREDWGLEDPTGQSDEVFEATIQTICNKILALKEKLS